MMSDEFPKETLSLCRFAIVIVILIVIECVNVNDASYSAWGQCNREMPIPCGENGVDEARDKARDQENSHANPGSTTLFRSQSRVAVFHKDLAGRVQSPAFPGPMPPTLTHSHSGRGDNRATRLPSGVRS